MCLQLSVLLLLVLRRKDCLPDIQMTSIEMDEHAETSREMPEKFTGVIRRVLAFLFWELRYARSRPLKRCQMKIMLENNLTHWRLINSALQKVTMAKSERERGGVLQGCGFLCLTCLCSGEGLIMSSFDVFMCSALGGFTFLLGKYFFGAMILFLSGNVYLCCCELIKDSIVPLRS